MKRDPDVTRMVREAIKGATDEADYSNKGGALSVNPFGRRGTLMDFSLSPLKTLSDAQEKVISNSDIPYGQKRDLSRRLTRRAEDLISRHVKQGEYYSRSPMFSDGPREYEDGNGRKDDSVIKYINRMEQRQYDLDSQRSGLEGGVALTTSIVLLAIGGYLLVSNQITGNVVLSAAATTPKSIGVLFLIAGLFFGLIWIKKGF